MPNRIVTGVDAAGFVLILLFSISAAPDGSAAPDLLHDDHAISATPHAARVCMWRLDDGKKLFALRKEAAGELLGSAPGDEQARQARQRQANSCALALEVRQAIGAK